MKQTVDILMATYNGANYLTAQIDSILTQTYPHTHLWIRDDGSQDTTLKVLSRYVAQYPEKITLLPAHQNLGIRGNFNTLLEHSQAPYAMLSDQDDIWLPNKVEISLDLMKKGELKYRDTTPLLVHSDLKVVSSNLSAINDSFAAYAGIDLGATSLNRILTQNSVTGCTMLINRPLINMSIPIPNQVLMHDWWIALIASAFGHILTVPLPTILYRQHATNDTGAKSYSLFNFLTKKPKKSRKSVQTQTYEQATLFLDRFESQLTNFQKELISTYASLRRYPYIKQKKMILKYRLFKSGFLRNLRHLLIPN